MIGTVERIQRDMKLARANAARNLERAVEAEFNGATKVVEFWMARAAESERSANEYRDILDRNNLPLD